MEDYYKFFKSDLIEEDFVEDEHEPLTSALKEIIGDGAELKKLLLAASEDGFAAHRGDDFDDEDEGEDFEVTEYPTYSLIGCDLSTSDVYKIQDPDFKPSL
jgi:hypothetical protein